LDDVAYAKAEGYTVQRQSVPYTLFEPIVTKTKAAEKEDSVKLDEEALQDALNAQGLSAELVREAM
jgi:dihydroxyacetone kinase